MQITHVEVIPVELDLSLPYRALYEEKVERATLVFVRIDIQDGRSAWGCAAFDPLLTGETGVDTQRRGLAPGQEFDAARFWKRVEQPAVAVEGEAGKATVEICTGGVGHHRWQGLQHDLAVDQHCALVCAGPPVRAAAQFAFAMVG